MPVVEVWRTRRSHGHALAGRRVTQLEHKNETAYGEPDMNWSELKWLIHRAYKRAQNYFCDLSESDNHRQRTLSTVTLLECWYLVCSCARLQLLLAGVRS